MRRLPRRLPASSKPALVGLFAVAAFSGCAGTPPIGDDPGVAAAALSEGRALVRDGRPAPALAALARACADAAACAQALPMLEQVFLQRREPERGIEFLTRLIERHPALEAQALGHRGFLREKAVDLPRAEQDYERSFSVAPDPLVAERLGSLRMRLDDHAGALAAYRAGLEHEPRHVELRFLLGRTLRIENRLDEAREVLEGVLRDDPRHADVWANLGRIYLGQGKPDAARTALLQAIAFNPRAVEPRYLLTKMALAEGDRARAEALVREIRAIEDTFVGRGPQPGAEF